MMRHQSIQADGSAAALAIGGVLVALLGLASIEVVATSNRSAITFDPVFCSPAALHTTVEPPETQLTRDSAAIRILLKDAGDHFTQIRKIYSGEIHAPSANIRSTLLQRGSRGGLFKPDYSWTGSLRQEAQRLDLEQGTELALSVDRGIEAGDRDEIERALRVMFAALLDDLLLSIERKLAASVDVERAIQHARRYYSEGLEAYLTINAARQAGRASYALDAMTKAAEDVRADKSGAREWFSRERNDFVNAVSDGVAAHAERPQRL